MWIVWLSYSNNIDLNVPKCKVKNSDENSTINVSWELKTHMMAQSTCNLSQPGGYTENTWDKPNKNMKKGCGRTISGSHLMKKILYSWLFDKKFG